MRTSRRLPSLTSTALVAMFASACATAQVPDTHTHHSGPAAPRHDDILGSHTWPVTTSSPAAQAYFDQGVRLLYGFAVGPAMQAFANAREADPSCAMCWWGEAWATGPSFNSGMAGSRAPVAYAAVKRARELKAGLSPVERALIEAFGVRYAPEHPPGGRRGLDSAYVDAMAGVYARFPDHPEVGTLYAEALMLLEPRRGVWSLEKPSVRLIHEVLEAVLAKHDGHPGACHLYIHATETTPKVQDAQRCADLLGDAIPGVSHINHMPSHTYNRVGRWGDATAANIQAVETDRRAREGRGYSVYASHNLHMLLFSATVDGQASVAVEAAREYGTMALDEGAGYEALVLARFGRYLDVLELIHAPEHTIAQGWWAFARGLAYLRTGSPDSAAAYLARVDSLAEQASFFRFHSQESLLGIVGGLLRGELLRAQGDQEAATRAYEEAVTFEEVLTYDEPEPLPFLARDFLGAALLENGRASEAESVFRAALEARPHNGWSLHGLEQSLRAQGKIAEADEVQARFAAAWVRSDVELRASRF